MNFPNLEELAERLEAFIKEWNEKAHPFKCTSASGDKLIARYEQKIGLVTKAGKSGNLKINEKEPSHRVLKDRILQPGISLRQGLNIRHSSSSWQYSLVA